MDQADKREKCSRKGTRDEEVRVILIGDPLCLSVYSQAWKMDDVCLKRMGFTISTVSFCAILASKA